MPECLGCGQSGHAVRGARPGLVRWAVTQHERHSGARGHRELTDGMQILAVQRNRRAQHQQVGSGDRLQTATVLKPPYPWDAGSVIKPDDKFGSEIDRATLTQDEAHEVRCAVAW